MLLLHEVHRTVLVNNDHKHKEFAEAFPEHSGRSAEPGSA